MESTQLKDEIHKIIVDRLGEISSWYRDRRQGHTIPFYSSFDIRDSGHKIAAVDGNIYPAGFNNICRADKDSTVNLIRHYLDQNYGQDCRKILLLSEEHTQNAYYWDNVHTLFELIGQSGREVRIGLPRKIVQKQEILSASGFKVMAEPVEFDQGKIRLADFEPDLVISNNDFTYGYTSEWGEKIITPINPPRELGWYQRRKDHFFAAYNELSAEFAGILGLDPWHFQVVTEVFSEFDIGNENRREALAQQVEHLLQKLKVQSASHGENAEPFVFVKNVAGTYGLGVTRVGSGDEVRNWTYKERKKMKAAKGGGGFSEVILQEGVPTFMTNQEETSEPAIYLIGCQLAGGFLRTHPSKGPTESLNSPGAVYKRLCVSDLEVDVVGRPLENVYGWVARLGALAIGMEAKAMGVEYNGVCGI
jgi:glutamate--cysteine ligase